MQYTAIYPSRMGDILLAAREEGLTGLWFVGQKYFAAGLEQEYREEETPVLTRTRQWLDVYFEGRIPEFLPPLQMQGTEFQKEVWRMLLDIPYGETRTYGELAAKLAGKQNRKSMSAQAVGSAVGHNKISLIIPCHRVLGADGSLTGYAGGIERKRQLLLMEDSH